MYHIITIQDFYTLLSMSETKKNQFSPAALPEIINYKADDLTASKIALEKIGFFENSILSNKGRAITDALLAPEKIVITANSALIDQAPVSYCFKNGFWTVLAPDIESQLITIIAPVFVKDIKLFARQNMLYDLKLPTFERFSISLTFEELLIFELTQLVIIRRFKEKKGPLNLKESQFMVEDMFAEENALYITACTDYLADDQRTKLLEMIRDPLPIKHALVGLIEKGLIETTGVAKTPCFFHTQISHKWFMADGLLDNITLHSAPNEQKVSYRITMSGILKEIEQDDNVRFENVADLDLSMFDTVPITV